MKAATSLQVLGLCVLLSAQSFAQTNPFLSYTDNMPWSELQLDGLNDTVYALAQGRNGEIYAGGTFQYTSTGETLGIAVWDGLNWLTLGTGIGTKNDQSPYFSPNDTTVYDILQAPLGELYVAGQFYGAGDALATNIAVWNGTTWASLADGLLMDDPDDPLEAPFPGWVQSMVMDTNGNLYAAGRFNQSGSIALNNVAMWNGTTWASVGNGIDCIHVETLEIGLENELFALYRDSFAEMQLATWDGNAWSNLPPVLNTFHEIRAIKIDPFGRLVVAGMNFEVEGAINGAAFVAIWNGSNYTFLGTGPSDEPQRQLGEPTGLGITSSGTVYLASRMLETSPQAFSVIHQWNGSSWVPFSQTQYATGTFPVFNYAIREFLFGANDTLYVGGFFPSIGSTLACCIAYWNSLEWNAVSFQAGTGITSNYHEPIPAPTGEYYAVGYESYYPTEKALVANFNGSSWSPWNIDPVVGTLEAIARNGNRLYVGGTITTINGVAVSSIATFNGGTWSGLGPGVNGTVKALVVNNDGVLYAGGQFSTYSNPGTSNIAAWTGGQWRPLANGLNDTVLDLSVGPDGNLYASGYFTATGTQRLVHVGMWNGASWAQLGSGLESITEVQDDETVTLSHVRQMLFTEEGDLFICGLFRLPGSPADQTVLRWDGTEWQIMNFPSNFTMEGIFLGPDSAVYGKATRRIEFENGGYRDQGLIVRWNGQTWIEVPFPYNAHGIDWMLAGSEGQLITFGDVLQNRTQPLRNFTLNLPIGVLPQPQALFGSTYYGNNFYLSSWFGRYFDTDPTPDSTFLYSMDIGWVWVDPLGTYEGLWWWSFAFQSWLWGNEATGTYYYRASDGVWIFVVPYGEGGSFILDTSTEEWTFLPPQ